MPRWPLHSKYWTDLGDGWSGASIAYAKPVPCDRHLRDPANRLRRLDPREIQHRGQDIADVVELVTDPGSFDPIGPVQDEWDAHSAAVDILLVPAQRCVAHLCPSPGQVAVAMRSADVIQVDGVDIVHGKRARIVGVGLRHHAAIVRGGATAAHSRVHQPGGTAHLARPVVGRQDEDRVVQLADFAEIIDQPAASAHPCDRGKPANASCRRTPNRCSLAGTSSQGTTPGLRGASSVPGGRIPARLLSLEVGLAHGVPTAVEAAPVLLDVWPGRLVRLVHRAQGEVHEKRLARPVGSACRAGNRSPGQRDPR